MDKMKFKYLVESCVASNPRLNRKEAEELIRGIFIDIAEALAHGMAVSIRNFGTFKPVERKERVVREPRTGKKVKIPAKIYPKFSPSPALKDMLNE